MIPSSFKLRTSTKPVSTSFSSAQYRADSLKRHKDQSNSERERIIKNMRSQSAREIHQKHTQSTSTTNLHGYQHNAFTTSNTKFDSGRVRSIIKAINFQCHHPTLDHTQLEALRQPLADFMSILRQPDPHLSVIIDLDGAIMLSRLLSKLYKVAKSPGNLSKDLIASHLVSVTYCIGAFGSTPAAPSFRSILYILNDLLSFPNDSVKMNVITSFGSIVSAFPSSAKFLSDLDIIPPLIRILAAPTNNTPQTQASTRLSKLAAVTLSSMAGSTHISHDSLLSKGMIPPLLYQLTQFCSQNPVTIQQESLELGIEILWLICVLTRNSSTCCDRLYRAGMIPYIISCLSQYFLSTPSTQPHNADRQTLIKKPDPKIAIPVIRTISNFFVASQKISDNILKQNESFLKSLNYFLDPANSCHRGIVREALWFCSTVSEGTSFQRQCLVDHGFLQRFTVHLTSHPDMACESLICLQNICSDSPFEILPKLSAIPNVLSSLVHLIGFKNIYLLISALKFLYFIIDHTPNAKMDLVKLNLQSQLLIAENFAQTLKQTKLKAYSEITTWIHQIRSQFNRNDIIAIEN